MKKRGKALLILSTAFALTLSGCGSSSSSISSPSPSPAGATNNVGQKQIKLRVGTWDGGDSLKLQQQIADNYMKLHSNVEISIESVPDQYGTKILTQIAADQAPDIFQIGDGDVSMFVKKGALEDLTVNIQGSNGIKLDNYYTNVIDVGKFNGKYYTMPKDYGNLVVYYNKKLFDEAKIPYPQKGWTWAQFYDIAKKLTKKESDKYTQWGVNLPGSWTRAVYPLINAYGGSVISPDGEKFEGFMNSDGTVKALQMYQDMYQKDHISPSSTDTQAFKGLDLFGTGKVAMNISSIWPLEDYKANKDLSFGDVQLPVGPSGAANAICYAGYGLYNKTANKDAAWDYLKYLTGPEGQEILAKKGFTAVKSVAEKLGQTNDQYLKVFLDDIPNIKEFPEKTSPFFAKSGAKPFQTIMDKMMLGKPLDIKKELDAAAKQAEADLKTAKSE